jgi:hypothetical protein
LDSLEQSLRWLADAYGLEVRVLDEGDASERHHAPLVYDGEMVLVESERPHELHGNTPVRRGST